MYHQPTRHRWHRQFCTSLTQLQQIAAIAGCDATSSHRLRGSCGLCACHMRCHVIPSLTRLLWSVRMSYAMAAHTAETASTKSDRGDRSPQCHVIPLHTGITRDQEAPGTDGIAAIAACYATSSHRIRRPVASAQESHAITRHPAPTPRCHIMRSRLLQPGMPPKPCRCGLCAIIACDRGHRTHDNIYAIKSRPSQP
jgi:hypothetical protein